MDKKQQRKLIVVLRHITPSEIEEVCGILVEEGFPMIEVTANTKNYIELLSKTIKCHSGSVMIGAGTVTTEEEVQQVHEAGGSFIVSPHTNPSVISKTKSLGMLSIPGIFTPTEAFTAIESGADVLKFFPASWATPTAAKDLKAVLPNDTLIYAIGGVKPEHFSLYRKGGFDGFGIGNFLYRPGISLIELRSRCKEIIEVYDEIEKIY